MPVAVLLSRWAGDCELPEQVGYNLILGYDLGSTDRSTYDKKVDLPTSSSPNRSIDMVGSSPI